MHRRLPPVTIAALLSAAVSLSGLAACGGDDDDSVDAGSGDLDAGIGCLEDPRAETFVANMERDGMNSMLSFVLEAGDPAPPVKGNNTWTVQVRDSDGAPLTGATVTVHPFMPDHGHGTSVVPQVSAGDGDGEYTVDPLYLFMPGLWEITITAESGDVSDSAKFSFCVEG